MYGIILISITVACINSGGSSDEAQESLPLPFSSYNFFYYASVGGATRHTVIVRVCVCVCVSVRSSSERRQRISWW